MRIAGSSVNMVYGRNYVQTGMRAGGGYANSFMGMMNSYGMKKESSMGRDTYQKGNNAGLGSYNMDDIGYFNLKSRHFIPRIMSGQVLP